MKIKLIDKTKNSASEECLKKYYDKNLLVPEKKPFFSDHKNSVGAFLAVEEGKGEHRYILDAGSQIASLGLGYNASALFGTGHHLESWLNRNDTEHFSNIRQAFRELLRRKLNWSELEMFVCNSGAEASEVALGDAYAKRVNKEANKVLAFEDSFHGRMLVSLSSTWNPGKREPFQIPGKESIFVKTPKESAEGQEFPKDWAELWERAVEKDFEKVLKNKIKDDGKLISNTAKSLLQTREHLVKKKIFAIMIEPMQCEGGDCYLSSEFFQALFILAKSYNVPIILDEVQTGFSLSEEFFWHKLFVLKNSKGEELQPDYITCAKKAQVGLVLSSEKIDFKEEFSVSSFIRGYIQASILDQYQNKVKQLAEKAEEELSVLVQKHKDMISSPRGAGLAFSFDFKDKENLKELIAKRFEYGLLYYSAGERTARFRITLSWTNELLEFFFKKLDNILKEIKGEKPEKLLDFEVKKIRTESQYNYHSDLTKLQAKFLSSGKTKAEELSLQEILKNVLFYYMGDEAKDVEIDYIDRSNYSKYRDKISELEELAYEPLRRTSIEEFDLAIEAPNGVALALNFKGKMVGIVFGAPLQRYPDHRGVRRDPNFTELDAVYMLDVTVHPDFQGKSLGRVLKYAFSLLCLKRGVSLIQGRNRDRLARGMFSINLALGAFELMHLEEDYLDTEEFRDALYYSIKLAWQEPKINLSSGSTIFDYENINDEFIKSSYPSLVNKISLGNFVNRNYLESLENFTNLLPKELRHTYVTSGQSEAIDKIFKAIWLKNKPKERLLSFKGHFFGEGSFLSRALSQKDESFFAIDILDNPNSENFESVLNSLEKIISKNKTLAIFLEPLPQRILESLPFEFLKRLKLVAKKFNTPVIYNDTASLFYRYNKDSFLASSVSEITPDGAFSFLGGQMSICYLNEEIYNNDPLKLISTWDGDEFSFNSFTNKLKEFQNTKAKKLENRLLFEARLRDIFKQHGIKEFYLNQGRGWFKGLLSMHLQDMFASENDRNIVFPSDGEIERFLKQEGVS